MTTQDDSYPSQWFGRPGPTADQRAADVVMRQELEQCSTAELEFLADLKFMFKDDCPPDTRARSTTRLRVAQELLDERVKAAGTYEPDLSPPASRPSRWWQAP